MLESRLFRRQRRFVEAELRSSLEQINRNPFCERMCDSEHRTLNPIDVCLAPFKDGHETPTRGQVLTHWKSTKKWALVDPLSGEAAPCRLVARGVGRFAACKGSAAEAVAPITMRHRLPFAHYAAPYAAVLACKASDECSEFCDQAGLCAA